MDYKQQFNDFVVEHLDGAHKFANIYVKNPQDAEDVVSESIEKALRRIHTLKNPDLMKTWFYRIIINTSMNHLKRQSQTLLLDRDMPVFFSDDFSRLEFDDLLGMLPAGDRQIVHLRFFDNRELRDIARILAMNESTVKTRLYRALKKLKLEIAKDGSGVSPAFSQKKNAVKSAAVWSVSILLGLALMFNAFPALAAAAYDIPVVGDIVKVMTFYRFEYKNKGFEADIVVPEIRGLLDQELEDRINAEFMEFADEFIRSFEATVLAFEAEDLDNPDSAPAHMSIKADYTVKADNDHVLSIDAYLYSDVNSLVIHHFCTIDKRSGVLVSLPDLFLPDVDYVNPISAYIAGEMLRLNEEEGGMFVVGDSILTPFTAIQPDQNFYINNDGNLVICFDKYEVAAGPQGSPEFIIPNDVIGGISAHLFDG